MKAPPSAIEDERIIAAALVLGVKYPGKLDGSPFMDRLSKLTVASVDMLLALSINVDCVRVGMAMEALGYGTAEKNALDVADMVASTSLRLSLKSHVDAVTDAYERRKIIRWASRMSEKLRSGQMTAKEAREELKKVGRRA